MKMIVVEYMMNTKLVLRCVEQKDLFTYKRAVQEKGLFEAIEKARKENPFPAHHQR